MKQRKQKRKSRWISLANLRSIEVDKVICHRRKKGAPLVTPETYVQPLAHIYRCLLAERGKTDVVNIGAVINALKAWAHVHRFSFTDESVIPRAARKAVEHPRLFSADGIARWIRVSYEERQEIGLKTIGAYDKLRAERDRLWREEHNKQRREEYARDRDARGGMTREQYLEANSASRDQPWLALGISRPTYYRRLAAGEPVRQVFGRVSKKGFTARFRQPVSRAPEPAVQPSSGLPMMNVPQLIILTSTTCIPESTL